jgi:phage protein D
LLADGTALPGVLAATVSSNNHLASDRFSVRLAAAGGGLGAADLVGVRFDIQVGLDGGWSSLVVGEGDSVGFDPLRGVVDIEGRDLSALLIDSKVDETFANQTSSEIAATLAARHGLGISSTPTTTLVGRYYQSEHDSLAMGTFSKATSEWELLSYLAVQEGFDLYMAGKVLHFETSGPSSPIKLTPEDCISMHLEHQMGMERAIEVTVRSWDQRGARAVVQTVKGGGGGRVWKQSVVRPNLPPDDALRLAERILADLLRHLRTMSLTMPGDVELAPRVIVALDGTNTEWDGHYSVSEINRVLDVQNGYTQQVSLQRRA